MLFMTNSRNRRGQVNNPSTFQASTAIIYSNILLAKAIKAQNQSGMHSYSNGRHTKVLQQNSQRYNSITGKEKRVKINNPSTSQ